jgi:hypothetical protein
VTKARLVSVVLLAVVLVLALLLLWPDRDGVTKAAASPSSLPSAIVSLDPTSAPVTVPSSYFGLSTEYWALPIYERHLGLFERVLALLHVNGDGPMILRIGGDSADFAYWDPASRKMAPWVFELTPAWLSKTRNLVRQTGLRLIVDLNLVTGSPLQAGAWATAAERELPRGSIIGFEIGNEDDIYSHSYWDAEIARLGLDPSFLPTGFSSGTYVGDFESYAQVLARVAPGVPLVGPAIANPAANIGWITALLASSHPGLRTVSAHRYPYSACASRKSRNYPTISRILSDRASAGIARSVLKAARLAHRAGLEFRLTELNSVTCGGLAGVSNSFATALWAPDALFQLLQAGVDGVNLHVRANTINAPFALGRNGLAARPLLYGLILFTRALGRDSQLVRVHLHAARSLNLSAWAVRVLGDYTHVLLINKGGKSVRVELRLPASGPAAVQRLIAPSTRSTSGVTLDGQWLSAHGTWLGRPSSETLAPAPGGYALTIRGASAVLVTVHG